MKWFFLLLFFLQLSLFYGKVLNAAEIRVASAANFYPTLIKIKEKYEQTHQHKITIIRGSTGKLYAQILKAAPYDIFLSADSLRAEKLVQKNLSVNGSAVTYAKGQLALWHPDAGSSQQIEQRLRSDNVQKIAIANPRTAPYGRASVEALKALELYESLKPKLVYGENIAQTLQFVQSGAADLGFVARSYVNDDIYWQVDAYHHKPVVQKMLILKQSQHPDVAKSFFQFLQSEASQKIILSDGYLL